MNKYIYVSICLALSSPWVGNAAPPTRDRAPGDERKFEATHVFWGKDDTYAKRIALADANFESERVYLRSGSIIGMREFDDASTLVFELATGSRLGHVAMAFSTADIAEVVLRFIERGEGLKAPATEGWPVIANLEKAYAPYVALAEEWGDGSWERQDKKGRTIPLHPFRNRYQSNRPRAFGTAFHRLVRALRSLYPPSDLIPCEAFYAALQETRDNVQEGRGRFYRPNTEESHMRSVRTNIGRGFLDVPILIHMAPGGREGVHIDSGRAWESYEEAGMHDHNGSLSHAIERGTTSIIEPARDLTIEEIETLLFYSLYLKQAQAPYNYSQTSAGIYCQNCSEFIHNAFAQIGFQIGHEQRMDSLNINALGGGLRNVEWLLGRYSKDKIVITPKSVMQAAVPYEDENEESLPMRVVPTLDRLKIRDTVSEHQLWEEWEEEYAQPRPYDIRDKEGELKALRWVFWTVKNLFGSPFTSLSEEPFEAHSREGLNRVVPAQWSHMQLAGGGFLLGAAAWVGLALTRGEAQGPSEEVEGPGSDADAESNTHEADNEQASSADQEKEDNPSSENQNNA